MSQNVKNIGLLSLDGGGVRGLASLIILQSVFHVLNSKIQSSDHISKFSFPLKPCHFFDLMVGTSTGGLIAIMLGTLGMTVDECIKNYLDLAPKIFPKEGFISRSKPGKLVRGALGSARFPAEVLEAEVKRLVHKYTSNGENAVFDELPPSKDRSRVVVCSTHTSINKPVRLRSYHSNWEPSTHCEIWQAARATSAAPLYFDPIRFGFPPLTYGDGGFHYNNPVRIAVDESNRIWDPSKDRRIGCILSIGTGKPPLRAVGDRGHEILLSLKEVVTDTEQTAEEFAAEIEDMDPMKKPNYFRFNVEQGLEEVGLEEWDHFERLAAATSAYLRSHRKEIEDCADILLRLTETTSTNELEDIFLDLPCRTDTFVGRAAELSAIEEALSSVIHRRKGIVLQGMPGSGKTQLALEYISRNYSRYSRIVWIEASTSETVDQSFARCCQQIMIREGAPISGRQIFDDRFYVMDWLRHPRNRNWLMVLDSMDDLDQDQNLPRYCRDLSFGSFIVTSTLSGMAKACDLQFIVICGIEIQAAKELLLLRAFGCPKNDAERHRLQEVQQYAFGVVKRLDRLPLPIEQAAAIIGKGIIPIEEFEAAYRDNFQRLMDYRPQRSLWAYEKNRSIFTTFGMLFGALERDSPDAAALLSICSTFGSWKIPAELIQLGMSDLADSLKGPDRILERIKCLAGNRIMLKAALDTLVEAGVAKCTRDEGLAIQTISFHGLLCQWTVETMEAYRNDWILLAAYILASYLEQCGNKSNSTSESISFDNALRYGAIVQHCYRLIGQHVPAEELKTPHGKYSAQFIRVAPIFAQVFLLTGHFGPAKDLFQEALYNQICSENVEWSSSSSRVSLLQRLATACQKLGDFAEATEYLKRALELIQTIQDVSDDEVVDVVAQLKATKEKMNSKLGHEKAALVASTDGKNSGIRPDSASTRPYGTDSFPSPSVLGVDVDELPDFYDATRNRVSSSIILQTSRGHLGPVWSVAFSPDGKTLASGSRDKTVRLWHAGSGAALQALNGHLGPVQAVAFSPDGKTLASASSDKTVRLWDAGSGAALQTLEGHSDLVWDVAFSPDGKILASASLEKTVRLWDAGSGAALQTLEGHSDSVRAIAFSPDGKTLASASWDKTVRLWDAGSGAALQTLEGHSGQVSAMAFSPDGKTLASASGDKTVRLWDAGSGAALQTLKGHSNLVGAVAFSPDGKTLASASWDKTVRLWDAGSGAALQTLEDHSDSVWAVAFSPDGKTLASVSQDKTVRLWDAGSGAALRTLEGHSGQVSAMAFSPDGKTLASASGDKTVRLWDAGSGAALQTLGDHSNPANAMTFSPDGREKNKRHSLYTRIYGKFRKKGNLK